MLVKWYEIIKSSDRIVLARPLVHVWLGLLLNSFRNLIYEKALIMWVWNEEYFLWSLFQKKCKTAYAWVFMCLNEWRTVVQK